MGKIVTLGNGYMLTGIIGFLISTIYLWNYSPSWSVAFSLFFAILVVASLVSAFKGDD